MQHEIVTFLEFKALDEWESGDVWKPYMTDYKISPVMRFSHPETNAALAGIDSNQYNQVIAGPRGIPSDTCSIIDDHYRMAMKDARNGNGPHKSSYVTLQEMIKYDAMNPVLNRHAYITDAQYMELVRDKITPKCWVPRKTESCPNLASWSDPAQIFQSTIMLIQQQLAHHFSIYRDSVPDSDVRMVFWFVYA